MLYKATGSLRDGGIFKGGESQFSPLERKQKSPLVIRRCAARVNTGFTLLEIMVVIVIIGILASLVVPRLIDRPAQARKIKAQQDILTLENALELYKLDNGRYPTTAQSLKALVKKPSRPPVPKHWKKGGYIKKLREDPWGNPYQYRNPGKYGEIDIFSYGADGIAGGEEENADIGNWQ